MKLNKRLTNLVLIGLTLMPVTIQMAVLTPNAIAQEQNPVAPILQEVLPQLRQMSQLPILLPSELPPETERLYVGGSAGESSYNIEIGYTPDCSGSACMVGSFSASTESFGRDGNPITLVNGIRGYYLETTCPICGDSSLSWEQNGVSYLIRYKVPAQTSKQVLEGMMRMANSAIKAGAR
ncbi:MAG: hypothetical protein KME25_30855 [Symplocastrum torsivum CPER-KK1]|jgi:hypothetical protein|uniref:Uncharacterized protein n=1 Tax=Symplocastrum torsivum CPER-KK1 TaxID=450513 RepID=A0A951UDC1_9CYAN|nr:hypothetical protein [Symplocastrum torsivum CPER-KK1]